ncbi:hypothetical protein NDI49_29345 [Trichocoleus sp. ST-U3]
MPPQFVCSRPHDHIAVVLGRERQVYYSIMRSQFAQQSKKVVLPLSSEANSRALDLTQQEARALACPLR